MLLRLGGRLFDYLDAMSERVAVLASSDLAHTHLASGPYGYSAAAKPFDKACGLWAADPEQHASQLLEVAASLASKALSCGIPSLLMLHGM